MVSKTPVQENQQAHNVPGPEQFRGWVQNAIEVLNVSPWFLGNQAGLPSNGVKKFLNRSQDDVKLQTAHKIINAARKIAATREIDLPDPTLISGDLKTPGSTQ